MFLLLACAKPPPESPSSLAETSAMLLRDFEEGDDVVPLAQEVADWLVVHVDEQDGFSMDTLDRSFYADMQPQPEYEEERLIGIGVTHRVLGSLDQHVAVVPEGDQRFADPSTYDVWDRTIIEGTGEGFVAGGPLRTDNWIEKGGPMGVVIPYPLKKDYRWVTLTQGETCIFRSWDTESGFSENGKNGLVAGFTIEVWVPDDAGLIWYNASWADIVTEIDDVIGQDYKTQSVIDGTIDYMDGTDAHATGTDQG